jgi:Tol biopolymer transport system component
LCGPPPDGRLSSADPASGAPVGGRLFIRISPDGSRAIVSVPTPRRRELWLADWTRDLWTACADCNSEFGLAVWSPDGGRLLFGRNDTLVARAVGGSAPDQVLIRETGHPLYPIRWLADARIVYISLASSVLESFEIKLLEPGGSAGRAVVPFGMASDADVSADGHWLAYTSKSPQENQGVVFMRAFPDPGPRIQVSAVGSANPSWSANGKTLYYLMRDLDTQGQAVMAVDIVTAGGLTAGKPRRLFVLRDRQSCAIARCYDLSADGRRFLFRDRGAARRESVTRMDLVLNWTSTLARRRSLQ